MSWVASPPGGSRQRPLVGSPWSENADGVEDGAILEHAHRQEDRAWEAGQAEQGGFQDRRRRGIPA